jgi:hypothetical protein
MLTGSENIGIGGQVMNTNTAGDGNIGIGRQALYVASGGSFNIAIGSYTSNALGGTYSYNTSVGYNSTRLLASGQYNTAFGYQALYHSTTDDYNIAIGANAGNSKIGSQNIYIQNNQMDYIGANSSSGIRNIVMGYRADLIGTPASYNVIAGSLLFYSGNYNVHIGNHSQPYNNYGNQNTVLGQDAFMNYNSVGAATPMEYNTFIGVGVGTRCWLSTSNVVVGMGIAGASFGPATWMSGVRNIGLGAPYVAQIATGNWSGLTGNDNIEFITNASSGIMHYNDETATTRHIKSNKLNIQRTIVGDTSTKRVFIGNANSYTNLSPDATLEIIPLNTTDKVLLIQGIASQAGNYLEVQNASSVALASIDSLGQISGIALNVASGITLPSGIPAVTTSKLYASGTTLYFNGSTVGGGAGGNPNSYVSGVGVVGWVPYFNTTSGIAISSGQSIYMGSITSANSSSKALVAKSVVSQSVNIFEIQDYLNNPLLVVDSVGKIGIGTGTIASSNFDMVVSADVKCMTVRGPQFQTKNFLEFRNYSDAPVFSVSSAGSISGAIAPTIITATGGLTLNDTHHGYIIEQTGIISSGTFTIGSPTIPGWNCMLVNIGSGVIVASGSNTMRSPGGLNRSRTQYSSISIYRRNDGSFILGGDLA